MTEPTQPAPAPGPADDGAPVPPPPVAAAPPPLVPASPPPVQPPVPVAPSPGAGAPPPRPPIYPMVTTFDETVTMSRLWGIPILGVMFRGILLIPHYIILAFWGLLVAILQLFVWLFVLVNGQYPDWGYAIVGGYIRWYTRVQAYALLLAASYPPFSTSERHDVSVAWDESQKIPRWAGIPILGVLIRMLLLIPHGIILYVLGILVGLLSLVTWIPVLLNGRYADWAYRIVGGFIRWQNRVTCYVMLMTGPYPPFSLDD